MLRKSERIVMSKKVIVFLCTVLSALQCTGAIPTLEERYAAARAFDRCGLTSNALAEMYRHGCNSQDKELQCACKKFIARMQAFLADQKKRHNAAFKTVVS